MSMLSRIPAISGKQSAAAPMMSIVSTAGGPGTSTNTITLDVPVAGSEGDLLIMAVTTTSSSLGVSVAPSGWVAIATTGTYLAAMYYRYVGSNEPSSVTIVMNAFTNLNGFVLRYSTARYGAAGTLSSQSLSSVALPSVTSTESASTLLAIVASSSAVDLGFASAPTGFSLMTTPGGNALQKIWTKRIQVETTGTTTITSSGTTMAGRHLWIRPRELKFPIFIGQTSAQATAQSVTASVPSGTIAGDLIVAFMASSVAASGWTQPSGFTEVLDAASSPSPAIAYKVSDGTETSLTFTTTATTSNRVVTLMVYRNAAWGGIGSVVTGATTLSPTLASAVDVGARIIGYAVRATASITITCSQAQMRTQVIDADTIAPSYLIADESWASGGIPATRSFNMGSTTSVAAVLCYLKPVA